MRCLLFVFVLFDLLGVPLKSVILVFLFLFVLSLRHVLNMHAPRPHTMDWSVNDSFIRYACLFVFNVLFCSLYSLTFRLACSQHARNCVRTCSLSPGVLAVCFYYLFLFNVYLWKFLRIVCVLFFCSRGLNLSFLHRFFPSFLSFCWIQICFAYTEFFKNFYIQSHCLPTFFCCFCWSGFIIISFLFRLDSSRIWFLSFSIF